MGAGAGVGALLSNVPCPVTIEAAPTSASHARAIIAIQPAAAPRRAERPAVDRWISTRPWNGHATCWWNPWLCESAISDVLPLCLGQKSRRRSAARRRGARWIAGGVIRGSARCPALARTCHDPPMDRPIRIALADDAVLLREALAAALAAAGFEVIGQAAEPA